VRTDSVSNHYGDKGQVGASGRHVWDTVRHYNNMIQAEPNDALQALTAQITDRGWRLAARKRSGADGEIEKIVTHRTQPQGVNIRAVVTKQRAAGQLHQGTHHVH